MTPRERNLAAIVGSLLLLCGGYFGYGWITAGFAQRRSAITSVNRKIKDQERLERVAKEALSRLDDYRRRSLPSDVDVASSTYQSWLLQLTKEHDVRDCSIVAIGGRKRSNLVALAIRGNCTLPDLTALLHEFYSRDILHRIVRLSATPIPESKRLELQIDVEGLIVSGAGERFDLPEGESKHLKKGGRKNYDAMIVQRNMFSPGNRPPVLSMSSSKEIPLGDSVSVSVKATDPDKLDKVLFALKDAPAKARIDSESGSFSFRPEKLGDYQATIIATDDGIPKRSVEKTLTITVVKPPERTVVTPPAKPESTPVDFTAAKFAYVTALNEQNVGKPYIWLHIRTTGKLLTLYEGDKFTIGKILGEIRLIDLDRGFVELQAADRHLRASLGQNLAEAQRLPEPTTGE